MKLTQDQKAAALGISQGEYSKIITGTRPVNINFARKLETLVGRDFTEFLKMTPDKIDDAVRTCLLQDPVNA